MTIVRDTITKPDQIKEIVEQKSQHLGDVRISVALVKDKTTGNYALRFMQFFYEQKGNTTQRDEEYNYGDITFLIKTYTKDDAFNIIKFLFNNQELSIDKYKILPINIGSYLSNTDVESYYPYGYLMSEWPATYLASQIQGFSIPNIQNTLAKVGLPSFPDANTAIVHLFGLNSTQSYNQVMRQVEIIIPDYKCRIKKIIVEPKMIKLSIEANGIPTSNLVAKVSLKYSNNKSYYGKQDFKIINSEVKIPIDSSLVFAELSILSLSENTILDYRSFNIPYWHDYNNTVLIREGSSLISINKNYVEPRLGAMLASENSNAANTQTLSENLSNSKKAAKGQTSNKMSHKWTKLEIIGLITLLAIIIFGITAYYQNSQIINRPPAQKPYIALILQTNNEHPLNDTLWIVNPNAIAAGSFTFYLNSNTSVTATNFGSGIPVSYPDGQTGYTIYVQTGNIGGGDIQALNLTFSKYATPTFDVTAPGIDYCIDTLAVNSPPYPINYTNSKNFSYKIWINSTFGCPSWVVANFTRIRTNLALS